jgi:DNA-binding response OmpR family regulator
MSARILIVEDDTALAILLRDNLVFEGYTVDIAVDAISALAKASEVTPDLVLLDLMLPDGDGFEVCHQLSEQSPRTSVVILSARQEQRDKVRALGLGADDYITKPWAMDELIARIHAVLRRTHPGVGRMQIGRALVDFSTHEAFRGGLRLFLTTREFELLQFLAERQGRVASRDEVLQTVWGYHTSTLTRTVDNFIARLRRKIEVDPRHPRHILTAHGGGYYLVP